MSRLRIFDDHDPSRARFQSTDAGEIATKLAGIGVRFEQWRAHAALTPGAPQEAVLDAYREDVDRLIAEYGFESVDVVGVTPDHPDREALRRKFLDEHVHHEDEVRFFVAGSGLFSLHPEGEVYEVLCEAGDLISVPDRTRHWFDMGEHPDFVAIRFFKRPDGWVGHFTGTDIATRFPRLGDGEPA